MGEMNFNGTSISNLPLSLSNLSNLKSKMLKAPEHQVAGHFAGDGELGPLIDGHGIFIKPLQSSERGSTEVNFYTFSSDSRVPSALRARFFPSFHGTQLLSTGVRPQHLHLALEDLTADLTRASVVDFKIMSRTWAPTHPFALGFHVYGLQIYGGGRSADGDCWKPSRDDVMKFTWADVRCILRRFVSHGDDLDCGLAKEINVGQLQFCCQYWVIVAILTTFERFFDIFVSWLLLYAMTKLAFFIYLRHPKAMGMRWVYACVSAVVGGAIRAKNRRENDEVQGEIRGFVAVLHQELH